MADINIIYNEIKSKITIDHLKKITVDIINSYKNKNYRHLRKYISILKINSEISDVKLFSILVKKYHPDKYSFIQKQAEDAFNEKDFDKLSNLHSIYIFDINKYALPEIEVEFEPEYSYDESDFGYQEKNIYEEDNFGETNLDYEDAGYKEYGFIEALRTLYFGGIDIEITESDLKNLDGELDLSDYGLDNLRGIETCIYLTELNLSNNNIEKTGYLKFLVNLKSLYLTGNSIENISSLEDLKYLKELDISFNNISDISVLECLPVLEYVNIIGNPVKDYTIVDNLIRKGVIVIYDSSKHFLY